MQVGLINDGFCLRIRSQEAFKLENWIYSGALLPAPLLVLSSNSLLSLKIKSPIFLPGINTQLQIVLHPEMKHSYKIVQLVPYFPSPFLFPTTNGQCNLSSELFPASSFLGVSQVIVISVLLYPLMILSPFSLLFSDLPFPSTYGKRNGVSESKAIDT